VRGPAAARTAYLDHAATTPIAPAALEALVRAERETFANPSGAHRLARAARRSLDEARQRVARLVGREPEDVVFTSGGSEADNLAVAGVEASGAALVVSAIEHRAVLRPASRRDARTVPARPDGVVDLDALAESLHPGVRLVSVMAVNNELGTIQPVAEVVALVRELAPEALVHTDAVQAFAWLDLPAVLGGCDLVSLSAHKFGGPKGIGALIASRRARAALRPLLLGGGQESALRAGTQNVAGAVAMAAAAEATAASRAETAARVRALRDRLEDGLVAAVAGLRPSVPRSLRVPGACPLLVEGVEGEELLLALDARGVAASIGSSCASGAHEESHVLAAIGLAPSQARGALRLSLGAASRPEEIDHALEAIPRAVAQLRAGGLGD